MKDLTFMSGKQKVLFFRRKQAVAKLKDSIAREIVVIRTKKICFFF